MALDQDRRAGFCVSQPICAFRMPIASGRSVAWSTGNSTRSLIEVPGSVPPPSARGPDPVEPAERPSAPL